MLADGRLEEALDCFRGLLAENRDRSQALNGMGACYFQAGMLEEALECFRGAAEADPANADALVNLSIALRKSGRTGEALAILERANAVFPCDPDFLVERGRTSEAKGMYEEAERCYRAAIGLDNERTEAALPLSALLISLGRCGEAQDVLNAVLERDAGNAAAWNNLAVARELEGDATGAEEAYRRAHASTHAGLTSVENLVKMLVEGGRHVEAEDLLAGLLEQYPDQPGLLLLRGRFYLDCGCTAEAFEDYEALRRSDPTNVEAWSMAASILAGQGLLEQARNCYAHLVQVNPRDAEVWRNMAALQAALGKHQEALEAYARAVELEPECPEAWYGLALVSASTGSVENAEAAYRRCLELDPQRVEAAFNLAVLLDGTGRFSEAAYLYGRFLDASSGRYPRQEGHAASRLRVISGEKAEEHDGKGA